MPCIPHAPTGAGGWPGGRCPGLHPLGQRLPAQGELAGCWSTPKRAAGCWTAVRQTGLLTSVPKDPCKLDTNRSALCPCSSAHRCTRRCPSQTRPCWSPGCAKCRAAGRGSAVGGARGMLDAYHPASTGMEGIAELLTRTPSSCVHQYPTLTPFPLHSISISPLRWATLTPRCCCGTGRRSRHCPGPHTP